MCYDRAFLQQLTINTMKLRPLKDRVILKVTKQDARTIGGIIIPNNGGDDQPTHRNVLTVEAAGPDVTTVAVGDTVIVQGGGMQHQDADGTIYIVLNESQIMAVDEA